MDHTRRLLKRHHHYSVRLYHFPFRATTYSRQTSLVSTRIVGADSDDDGEDTDDGVAGAVSEGEVHAFARKSFDEIASPYLAPYIYRKGVLDAEYCLRKEAKRFLWVISMYSWILTATSILGISILKAHGFSGKILTRKRVDNGLISLADLKQYNSIFDLTSAHLEG